MHIDIKAASLQQKRQAYKHLAKRFGEDRPASRYEEGTLDLAPETNFHYRPLWDTDHELYDQSRSRITMKDWYALRDPRQFYYANYNITRAGQIESVEHNFDMVEKRGMLSAIPAEWVEEISFYLLPLRHYEWGANMNNCQITALGHGAALTSPTCFAMGDRLGIAQLIGRIGLAIASNNETALNAAKDAWINHPDWQGVRKMVEDSLVIEDPMELFVAQNLAFDGIVYPLVYGVFSRESDRRGGAAISFLCSFMNEWFEETGKWVDAVIKIAAAENDENKALLKSWFTAWESRAVAAFKPLSVAVLGAEAGAQAIADVAATLKARAAKLGIA